MVDITPTPPIVLWGLKIILIGGSIAYILWYLWDYYKRQKKLNQSI